MMRKTTTTCAGRMSASRRTRTQRRYALMHQDAPGLQLLSRTELEKGKDGAWIDAPVVDAFIVIVGTFGANGVLRAAGTASSRRRGS